MSPARVLLAVLAVLAVALVVASLGEAILHLRDLTGVQHLVGIWMGQAWYLDQGVFYPPLEADGCYAGTRYMPVLFVLIAALARLTGGYLLAAKLSAVLSVALLLAGVFRGAWRVS